MGNFDIDHVSSLLELYSDAVELYGSQQDKRYMLYEKRMKELMVKPEVVLVMSGHKNDKSNNSFDELVNGQKQRSDSLVAKYKQGLSFVTEVERAQDPKFIQARAEQEAKEKQTEHDWIVARDLLKKDMDNQTSATKVRIAQRKQAKLAATVKNSGKKTFDFYITEQKTIDDENNISAIINYTSQDQSFNQSFNQILDKLDSHHLVLTQIDEVNDDVNSKQVMSPQEQLEVKINLNTSSEFDGKFEL